MRAKAAASKRAKTQVLCHGRAEAVATSASWSARGLSKVRMAKPREKRERKEAKRKEAQGSLGVILGVTSEVGFGQRSGLRSETIGVLRGLAAWAGRAPRSAHFGGLATKDEVEVGAQGDARPGS